MNRRNAIHSVVAGTAAVAFTATEARAAGKAVENYTAHWQQAKTFTLKVVDAMPADSFDFKPKPDMRGFGQLMQHLGSGNVYYISRFQHMQVPDSLKPPTKFDKETTQSYVSAVFDFCEGVIKGLNEEALDKSYAGRPNAPELTGWELLFNAFVHTAHHRGYAEVYLREKNIVPPTYAV